MRERTRSRIQATKRDFSVRRPGLRCLIEAATQPHKWGGGIQVELLILLKERLVPVPSFRDEKWFGNVPPQLRRGSLRGEDESAGRNPA